MGRLPRNMTWTPFADVLTCPLWNHKSKNALAFRPGRSGAQLFLKQVPEELVVYLVVILHFGSFHKRAQSTRTAIRGGLLQVRVASLHVFTQKLRRPVRFPEVV